MSLLRLFKFPTRDCLLKIQILIIIKKISAVCVIFKLPVNFGRCFIILNVMISFNCIRIFLPVVLFQPFLKSYIKPKSWSYLVFKKSFKKSSMNFTTLYIFSIIEFKLNSDNIRLRCTARFTVCCFRSPVLRK